MHNPVVIFDFDGTLVDSSPGIMHAINMLAERHHYPAPSLDAIEAVISMGSAAMLKVITGLDPDSPKMPALQKDFFALYQRHGLFHNQLYQGVNELLLKLNEHDIPWGIMTNGRSPVVTAMLSHLGLAGQAGAVVCVDHVKNRKPDPEGLLKVTQQMKVSAGRCIYVGDAITDIQAGKAAEMKTAAALYGYVPADNPAENWGADYLIASPPELLEILGIK